MRLVLNSLCFLFFCFSLNSFGQKDSAAIKKKKAHEVVKKTAVNFLQLTGKVKELRQHETAKEFELDSVTIEVYNNNKLTTSELYTSKKSANIRLQLNQIYTIKASKNGFVAKFFEVNTEVPKDKLRTYNFTFELFLFKQVDDVDYTLLKEPVAIIVYQTKAQKFDYDYEYTEKINKKLKQQYKDLYYLKKE